MAYEALAAGIAAAGSLLSTGLSASSAQMRNQRQRRYQSQLMKEQNAMNIANWKMQNEYNSPAAQMARFQAAGLNPNLIYGQSNTAGSLPSVSAPNTPREDAPDFSGLARAADVYSKYIAINQAKANLANTSADTESKKSSKESIDAGTRLSIAKAVGEEIENEMKRLKLPFMTDYWDWKVKGMKYSAEGQQYKNEVLMPSEYEINQARFENLMEDKYGKQWRNKMAKEEYDDYMWLKNHGYTTSGKLMYQNLINSLTDAKIYNVKALTSLAEWNAKSAEKEFNLLDRFGSKSLSGPERVVYQKSRNQGLEGFPALRDGNSNYYRYLEDTFRKQLHLLEGKTVGAVLSGFSGLLGAASKFY